MAVCYSLLSWSITMGRLFLIAHRKRRTTRTNMRAYTAATARGRAVPITFRPPPLSAQRWNTALGRMGREFIREPIPEVRFV